MKYAFFFIFTLMTHFYSFTASGQQFELNSDEFDYLYRGNEGYVYDRDGVWYWKDKAIGSMDHTRFESHNFLEAIKKLRVDGLEVSEFVHQYYALYPNGLDRLRVESNSLLQYGLLSVGQHNLLKEKIDYYSRSGWYRGKNWGDHISPHVVLKRMKTSFEAQIFISWYVAREANAWVTLANTWDDFRFDLPEQTRRELYDQLKKSGTCSFYLTKEWATH